MSMYWRRRGPSVFLHPPHTRTNARQLVPAVSIRHFGRPFGRRATPAGTPRSRTTDSRRSPTKSTTLRWRCRGSEPPRSSTFFFSFPGFPTRKKRRRTKIGDKYIQEVRPEACVLRVRTAPPERNDKYSKSVKTGDGALSFPPAGKQCSSCPSRLLTDWRPQTAKQDGGDTISNIYIYIYISYVVTT